MVRMVNLIGVFRTISKKDMIQIILIVISLFNSPCQFVHFASGVLTIKSMGHEKIIFYPLEVVSRCRDPQLQVGKKDSHVHNLNQDIYANLLTLIMLMLICTSIFLKGKV